MVGRALGEKLSVAKTVAIIIHQSPDGDAIGSAVALREGLHLHGTKVDLVCVGDLPTVFIQAVGECPIKKDLTNNYDAYVLLDCCDLHRTGFGRQLSLLAAGKKLLICIDHHPENNLDKTTKNYIVDPKACSTAEVLYKLLSDWRWPISPKMATGLLLGVYTDTGAFIHDNTSEHTLKLASRLVYYGADFAAVRQSLLHQLPPNRQRLWGQTFAGLTINNWGVVTAKITLEHLRQTKTTLEDVNGLANSLAFIEEAKAALLLVETETGYRAILRTRHHHINLGRLARLLGGQGRQKAAGFAMTKTLFPAKITLGS